MSEEKKVDDKKEGSPAAEEKETGEEAEAATAGAKEGAGLRSKKSKSSCRRCRRAGEKLFLKGDKCLSQKCPLLRRNYAPGMHGQKNRRISEFGRQMLEKQKIRSIYRL